MRRDFQLRGVEPEPYSLGEHLVDASGKLFVLDKLMQRLKKNGVLLPAAVRFLIEFCSCARRRQSDHLLTGSSFRACLSAR